MKFARIENGIVVEIFDSIEVDEGYIEKEELTEEIKEIDEKTGEDLIRLKKRFVETEKTRKVPKFHSEIMAMIEEVEDSVVEGMVKTENGFEEPKPVEIPYDVKRKSEYPEIGDQLDVIWMQFNQMRLDGSPLIQSADDMLNAILKIKKDNPKPKEGER